LRFIPIPCLILAALSCGPRTTPEQARDDARILAQVLALTHEGAPDTFSVVVPDTELVLQDPSRENLASIAEKIRATPGWAGTDPAPLLETLLKRNKGPHPVPVESRPSEGYVVDRDGTYAAYLNSGNEGDWKRMYRDHPQVKNVKRVALPAVDPAAQAALVYLQTRTLTSSGNGAILVCRYSAGTVEILEKIRVWVP
jgi:hypothetical protein